MRNDGRILRVLITMIASMGVVPVMMGQTPCATPPSMGTASGQAVKWPDYTPISLRLDAKFSPSEQAQIVVAVAEINAMDAMASHHLSISISTAAPPPDESYVQNVVSFYNDASNSATSIATSINGYTQANGVNTNIIGAGNTFFNKGFVFGTTPMYDATASTGPFYFRKAVEHELLHHLGAADITPPLDSNGHPNGCLYTGDPSMMVAQCGTNDAGTATYSGKLPPTVTTCDSNAIKTPGLNGVSAGTALGGGSDSGGDPSQDPSCVGGPINDSCFCDQTTGSWNCSCQGASYQCPDGSESMCDNGNLVCPTVTTYQCDGTPPCDGASCVGDNTWDTSSCSTSCTDVCDPSCSNYDPCSCDPSSCGPGPCLDVCDPSCSNYDLGECYGSCECEDYCEDYVEKAPIEGNASSDLVLAGPSVARQEALHPLCE